MRDGRGYITQRQRFVCERYGALWYPSPPGLKVGIATNVRTDMLPINGLRHPPQGDTTGWYIWAGQNLGDDPNFFIPLHVAHLPDWCPLALDFLGLGPGWRFLKDGAYVDVWYDEALLKV